MKPRYSINVNINDCNKQKAQEAYALAKLHGKTHQDIYLLGCEQIMKPQETLSKD